MYVCMYVSSRMLKEKQTVGNLVTASTGLQTSCCVLILGSLCPLCICFAHLLSQIVGKMSVDRL